MIMGTQRWHLLLGCALIFGLTFSLPADAQSSATKRCTTAAVIAADERIAGCTAVIEQGQPATPYVLKAHFARATAYLGKGDVDRAIDDYKNVIQQSDLLAAYNRVDPDPHTGDRRPASGSGQPFGQDQHRLQAYRARGIASFQAGLLEQSQADFSRLSEMDPRDADAARWMDLVRRRAGLASELAGKAEQLDMSKWPAPIVRLFLGQETVEAVLAAADNGSLATRGTRCCVVCVFVG